VKLASNPFDFKASKAPSGEPLRNSHAAGDVENELKQVFLDLFATLGQESFDVNVMGAAHLGSFDLVQRMVNHDGLVLLPGNREEEATRYLYRAWKSGDVQKRGIHFVRTYLQLLFAGQAEVRQMWHRKGEPYGTSFIKNEPRDPYWFHFLGEQSLSLDAAWKLGQPLADTVAELPDYTPDESTLFLTSRIEILLGLESIAEGSNSLVTGNRPVTSGLLEVIRAVIPARLVPMFRFWLRYVLGVDVRMGALLDMEKRSRLRYPWCGRVITEQTDATWSLGRDGKIVTLTEPLGSFRLGEIRGGLSNWRLKPCRITSQTDMQSIASADTFTASKLGTPWLRLNRTWALSRPQMLTLSQAGLVKRSGTQALDYEPTITFKEQHEIALPANPVKLGAYTPLNRWRLNGERAVGAMRTGSRLGEFRLGRKSPATDYFLRSLKESQAAAGPVLKLSARRTLSGFWALGARDTAGESFAVMQKDTEISHPVSVNGATFREFIEMRYPGTPKKLARPWPLASGWRLSGQGLGSPIFRQPFPLPLIQDRIITECQMDVSLEAGVSTRAPVCLSTHSVPKIGYRTRRLDGRWPVSAYSRFGQMKLDGLSRLRNRKMRTARPLGSFRLASNEYSGLGILDLDVVYSRSLNGNWSLGTPSGPEFSITITHA